MVAEEAVLAGEAAALEERNVAVVEAHTAFFDVRGEEEAVAAVFAVAVLVVAAVADCGWHLHLAVAAENWRNTH